MSETIKAKDCANLSRDFNRQTNWCLLKDTSCPLIVKHDRYKFNRSDIVCNYLDKLNENGKPKSTKNCKGCTKKFKTSSNRTQYCSDTCREIARRKSKRVSKAKSRQLGLNEPLI